MSTCDCGLGGGAGHWLHEKWCAFRLAAEEKTRRASEIGIAAMEYMGDHEACHSAIARHARAHGRVLVRAEVA